MLRQFFFGASDSPLSMFHHALGAILILIFTCLFLAAILSWLSSRRKKKVAVTKKVVSEKKIEEAISVTPVPGKSSEPESTSIKESETAILKTEPVVIKDAPVQTVTEEIEIYEESVCSAREHLLLFTEILLNKKFTEQDWDKRMPEKVLLDHRSYHQLIFKLLYLNPDTTATTSRFKLVLETSTEVAINHQVYFRNWAMPDELIASFKSENNSSAAPVKKIRTAVKIAEKKNWKLQASTSEQGTMINLLMKLSVPQQTAGTL